MIRNQFILVLLFAITTSCAVTKGANVQHLPKDAIDDTHPRATLVLGSSELVNKVVITNVRVGQIGLLTKAAVDVQNLTDNRYNLEYKLDWVDQQGFPVNSNSVWHRFVLAPQSIKSFQGIGKTKDAYSIRFTIRFPDDLFIETDKRERDSKSWF